MFHRCSFIACACRKRQKKGSFGVCGNDDEGQDSKPQLRLALLSWVLEVCVDGAETAHTDVNHCLFLIVFLPAPFSDH